MRFDEVELQTVVVDPPSEVAAAAPLHTTDEVFEAPRFRRLMALLIDVSLFGAIAVGLWPLLPDARQWTSIVSLSGFVVIVSFYYFVGTWLLWGKTIGGAIFDVRVVSPDRGSMSLKAAALRWLALYASFMTAGIGFLLALLPSRRSLADRISSTYCVAGM